MSDVVSPYDVSKDGRFLMRVPGENESSPKLLAGYEMMRQASLVSNAEVVEFAGTTRLTAAELDGLTRIFSLQRLSQVPGSGPRIAH